MKNLCVFAAMCMALAWCPASNAVEPEKVSYADLERLSVRVLSKTNDRVTLQVKVEQPLATNEAAHTPLAEVVRVIKLLPKPEVGFIDFGCGYDARWCVAAAEEWKCRVTGVENDPARAKAARDRVRHLGLDHLITIIEGDVLTTDVKGDVAVVYLYPGLLEQLKPRLKTFRAFASYMHEVPGLSMQRNGDSWLYKKSQLVYIPQVVTRQAMWQGMVYNGPVCNSPHCAMCNSIRQQLGRN